MASLCAVCKVARNSDYLLVGLCGMDLQQSILTRKAIYVSSIKAECYATVEISKDPYHVRLISDPIPMLIMLRSSTPKKDIEAYVALKQRIYSFRGPWYGFSTACGSRPALAPRMRISRECSQKV